MKKVIVVGGGAAGMIAAIAAAKNNSKVILFEKKYKLGLKLGITGKGRCNLTNASPVRNHLENIITNSKFMISALSKFDAEMFVNFLDENGLKTKMERGNRVFPVSNSALKVVEFFHKLLTKSGVKIIFHEVNEIISENNEITGVKTVTGKEYFCDSVIMATGGLSYPTTGSTGEGIKFMEDIGHKIISTRPALVPIVSQNELLRDVGFYHLKNVRVTLKDRKKTVFSEIGEIDFQNYGLAGALAFTCSSLIKKDLERYKIIIDLKPGLDEQKLDSRILRDLQSNDPIVKALNILPQKMLKPVLDYLKINFRKQANQVTKKERQRLIKFMKEFTLLPHGFRSYKEAIITRGGVSVKEVNSSTMESKLIKNLFIVGEMLDVDALTGGYNLQIAFSTGFVAGNNC